MFPDGWPGAGLFVLRLATAIPLMVDGSIKSWGMPHDVLYLRFIEVGVGSLLLAGLWTPVAGVLQAIIQLWFVFFARDVVVVHLFLAALGLSVAMLGPGAWSVDARLFGRKRIDIRSR